MAKVRKVQRPTKKSEYEIEFASQGAQKGWRDLLATTRGPMVDCWDFLTKTPLDNTPTNSPMKGRYEKVTRDGRQYDRWQYKPTAKGDARIWFYVDEQTVYLERVFTHHPNETK